MAGPAGLRQAYVPAALVEGIEVLPVPSQGALTAHLAGEAPLQPVAATPPQNGKAAPRAGWTWPRYAPRSTPSALEIAAVGAGHNLFGYGTKRSRYARFAL